MLFTVQFKILSHTNMYYVFKKIYFADRLFSCIFILYDYYYYL